MNKHTVLFVECEIKGKKTTGEMCECKETKSCPELHERMEVIYDTLAGGEAETTAAGWARLFCCGAVGTIPPIREASDRASYLIGRDRD